MAIERKQLPSALRALSVLARIKPEECAFLRAAADALEQPAGVPDVDTRQDAAIALWHRFAPESHMTWAEEQNKAEYLLAVDAVVLVISANAATPPPAAQQDGTPGAHWREAGGADPHGDTYACERAALAHGDMTDDELANAVFLCDHRRSFDSIGLLTAAKDRIRWLSRALASQDAAQQGSAEAVSACDLFDPARLPDRDADGRVTHPDFGRVVFVEDEIDVSPFFRAAGLEFKAVAYDWPFEVDDGSDLNWVKPEAPDGDGWRLVSIGDTEDGDAVVWWCRYVGQQEALKIAPTGLELEMARVGHLIATQDNRITEAPIFAVQQRREYVTDPDFNDARMVWIDDEGVQAQGEELDELEAWHERVGDSERGRWRRLAVHDVWEFVTACFTEAACKEYVSINGHNLKETRIYAYGSYRNTEWRRVREHLLTLRQPVEGAQP